MGTTNSKVVQKCVEYNLQYHKWTTNSECNREENLIQFMASYSDNKPRRLSIGESHTIGGLNGENKLRKESTRQSHSICGILWGQQSHKEVYRIVSYILWHPMGKINSKSRVLGNLIQFVASYGDNKLKRQGIGEFYTFFGILWSQYKFNW